MTAFAVFLVIVMLAPATGASLLAVLELKRKP